MTSKQLLQVLVAGLTAGALVATGCSTTTTYNIDTGNNNDNNNGNNNDNNNGNSGSNNSDSNNNSNNNNANSNNSGSNVDNGGASGTSGVVDANEPNNDASHATALTVGAQAAVGALQPPSSDVDYFKFEGKKGDLVAIVTATTGTDAAGGVTTIDTALTLYGSDKTTKLAENNDAWPRAGTDAQLYTVLPADGAYYVRVANCTVAIPGCTEDTSQLKTLDYRLSLTKLDPATQTFVTRAIEPNDDADHATVIRYGKDTSSPPGYYLSRITGTYGEAGDNLDVFKFRLAADWKSAGATGRLLGRFWLARALADGSGSTSKLGKVWVVDSADLTKKVALVDATTDDQARQLVVPLTADHDYYLHVQSGRTAVGANDFYFVTHGGGASHTVEANEAGNNAASGAEVLPVLASAGGSYSYYVEGDLATGDVDHFSLTVPGALPQNLVSVFCAGLRQGSGLPVKFSLLKGASPYDALAGASTTEDAAADAGLRNVAIPSGSTTLLLKVEPGTRPDPDVTSSYYRCAAIFGAELR